ncbi:MAG: PD-(D/E)XK nuclease family protein [Treponema sp.]|jgi:hypothetical protein|nr:PD-(D/E)XK nuclease family protein [Treponema sp.]
MDEHHGNNPVEAMLLENIDSPDSLFVFPTDIAINYWADRLLVLRKGGSIAMEKFIAWDTFKQESIRARKQDKKSVPAVLRKIFASRLVRENAELEGAGQTPLFASLLPPKYAYAGAAFASWFAGILPQLGSWFEKSSGIPAALINEKNGALAGDGMEGDDRDLFVLAARYQQFLDSHGLFEPAWEKPPFDDTGKHCFIFFPESLMDYGEYAELLENSGHVTTVRVSAAMASKPCDTFFYANARSEITEAALYIRALHENRGVPFEAIAVSIGGDTLYEPYVLREFANRNIPFALRAGKPLASYAAGRLFAAIADCASRDFAFEALVVLLLNSHLPWKNTDDIDQLIDFGIKNNCVASWREPDRQSRAGREIHVWEDAFKSPMGGREERARVFYESLRDSIEKLCRSRSFAELRNRYFAFRKQFFNMDACLPETDLVLSRCISEMLSLIEIEKSFPDSTVPDPFAFFAEHLQEKNYLPQQASSGVAILPYRTAAPAPFECHVVLGATQSGLSAVFPRLGFLSRAKREALGLQDEDATEAFINLHRFNSRLPAAFFCARDSFSGHAIPHSLLNVTEKPRMRHGAEEALLFGEDPFEAEQNFCRALQNTEAADFPVRLHQTQLQGFNAWASRVEPLPGGKGEAWAGKEALMDLISERYAENREFPGKYSVSASSLEPYYNCALQWLFQRVLNLENIRIETSLMQENAAGSLYHGILNRFFSALKEDSRALFPLKNGALPWQYDALLAISIKSALEDLPVIVPGRAPELSALATRLFRAGKKHIRENMQNFLTAFLRYFAGYRVAESETSWKLEKDDCYLNGTVDCVLEDKRENSATPGAMTIVDFKLRNLPDREACDGSGDGGLLNFQLPLYMALAEERGKKPISAALFFSIVQAKPLALFGVIDNRETGKSEPKETDRILRADDSDPDNRFQLIMKEFWEKTERYAAEIKSGSFSTISGSFRKCVSCGYHTVCRTTYRVRGDSELLARRNIDG